MKLVRYGAEGAEKPGLVDDQGNLRDLSRHVADITGATVDDATLSRLRALDPAQLPLIPADTRLGPCIGNTRHFIAIGLNYADHAAEANMPIPQEPIVFSKAPSSIAGPHDACSLPEGATKVDWEVELAIVIGRRAYQVSEAKALDYVAGYCVCNDLSERAWQLERSGQWMKGKSAPGFGPLGPWLVTRDEIQNPLALDLTLDVNGERKQTGSTSTMIFGPAFLISYLSQFMALEPGDVITTGTPPGVGMASNQYLKSGDSVRLSISGLGEQSIAIR
ncbi:MAG TPA: fumarylacetoacetate hydrolase family protein [Burkholderiaceae bacterium]|nr:fumarylacetoacetate hydrolase family protein [Burkholderiaceae bacterium]